MLETPESRARLRRKLEIWPDDLKSPVTINQSLELLNLVESLEKEADWLAEIQNISIYSNLPAKCPEGRKPPRCSAENCMECWRKAAHNFVEQQNERK